MSSNRLDELRMVDPVLSSLAQEYRNAALVGRYLFPTVQVSSLKGKIPVFDKNSFVLRDTQRAYRAQSNRIQPSDFELVPFETKEQDIEAALDYLEEEENADFYKYEQRMSRELMDILLLGREKEIADLAQDNSKYDTNLKASISAADAFDDYASSSDPITIIRDAMASVRSKIAHYPNTMILGDATYQALINHPKIVERVKYSSITSVNTDILSSLLEMPLIKVGLGVYSNDGASYTDVWSDNIVLAYVDQNQKGKRNEYNPSFGYVFQRENMPEIDTYYENGGKIKVIRATDNYCAKIVAQSAAFLIENTNHA